MKEQLDVSRKKHSIKDDNLEEGPELRFQGFNENWKHEKIGELFDERSEKGYETLDLLSVTINNGVIKREDIDAKDNSSANKSNYKKVLPNDIVYNSMRMWQGASGKSEFEGIVSPAYTILIPKNVDSDFIGYLFKKETTLYQFRKYSQGLTSDTWNLKYPLISQIKINVPDLKEQIKISNFLSLIDEKIVFMQKTLGLYQKHIKYNINEIYSNTKNYEEIKIKNIFKSYSSNLSINKLEDNFGKYLLYGAEGAIKSIDFYEIDTKYITIIKDGAGVGRLNLCDPNSSALGTLQCLIPKENYDINFLYFYLKTLKFDKYIVGSTIPHIYFKDYSKEKLKIPPLELQEQIGNYISLLNIRNNYIVNKINYLKLFKKGLLQKMFI